jgi:hypothetical protein
MQITLAFLAAAVLCTPWLTRQDEGPKPAPATRGHATAEAERISKELCGAWELVRADVSGQSFAGAGAEGYLIVTPGYCALEARLARPVQGGSGVTAGLTAGTYKWSYDTTRLTLALSTLMHGTDMQNDEGQIDYEPPGTRRDYQVALSDDDLTLTRAGGQTRMEFRRMRAPAEVKRQAR